MSIQAMSWAMRQTIVARAPERHLLLCLANYAGEDGRNAFPSVARLMADTGFKRRAVQMMLRAIEESGVIRLGEQRVAAAYVEREDRRPTVYDLRLDLVRPDDLEAADRPVENPVENPERGACHAPRSDATGRISRPNGAHISTERGACHAPDPLRRSFKEPSGARASEPMARAAPGEGSASRTGEAGGGTGKGLSGVEQAASAADPTGGVGADAAPHRGMTELKRRRMFEEIFLLDWLHGRSPFGTVFQALDLRPSEDAAEIEAFALGLSAASLRRVQSFVAWAEDCLAGRPDIAIPHKPVERLIEAFADPPRRGLMARRLAVLAAAAERSGTDDADTEESRDMNQQGAA